LDKISEEKGISLYEAINEYLKDKESKPLKDFYTLVGELRGLAKTLPLPRLVEETISKIGYYKYIETKFKEDKDERIENIKEFINMVVNFVRETENADLTTLLTQISLITSVDEAKDDNRVSLMTLHAAKGLEFPIVFLVGLEEGILPHFKSLDSTADTEEERRLCYVGVTRAKQKLFLTTALKKDKVWKL